METSTDMNATSQERIAAQLSHAFKLQSQGNTEAARTLLEEALRAARATPFEIEFSTRLNVALKLADLHLEAGERARAQQMLREEVAFAEGIFQLVQASGTPEQRRALAGGRTQLTDRARQLLITGSVAPEISVKEWIGGEPATLEGLRGRVVLLEFWATWCKPCQAMFPKLRRLDEEYRQRGLEIIALTRHYMAYQGTAEAQAEELKLMRKVLEEHDLRFRVGVSEDEATQALYGATGLPTLALIDRGGIVRYAHFGGEETILMPLLKRCLDETVAD